MTQTASAYTLLQQMELLGANPVRNSEFSQKNPSVSPYYLTFAVVASSTLTTCLGRKVVYSFFLFKNLTVVHTIDNNLLVLV